MRVEIKLEMDDTEKSILSAADAWYFAMMESNSLSAVEGYERSRWAHSGEENPYGYARARMEELIYDLGIPHEASVRLIEVSDEANEPPSQCLVRNAKFVFTGERY